MKKLAVEIPQYEARGYVENFEPKAQELFTMAFGGRTFPIEMWNWQFCNNPCLNKRITTLWDGECLVAMTGLLPSYATIKQETCVVAISCTTMARNDYKGVSLQLFQACRKQNGDIPFIYAFPNKNSYGIFTKYLGQAHVGDVAFWVCAPQKETRKPYFRRINIFQDAHGELYRRISPEYAFIKNRTKEYLNWRFAEKPNSGYEIYEMVVHDSTCGYFVVNTYLENGKKQLQVIDFVALTEDDLYEMLLYCKNLALEKECDCVKLWMTSARYNRVMSDLNFTYGEHPFHMTVWGCDIALSESYITMADSDIF